MDNPTDAAVEAKDKELWNEWLPSSGTSFGRFVIRHFLTHPPGTEDVDRIGIPAHAPTRSALDSAVDPMLGNTPVRRAVVGAVLGLFESARRPLTEVDFVRIAEGATNRRATRNGGYKMWTDLSNYVHAERAQFTRDILTAASWPMTAPMDSAASDRLAWLEKTHSETMDQNARLIVERDALNARVAVLESEVAAVRVERDKWKSQAFAPIRDNHHNALLCPHCNPSGLAAATPPPGTIRLGEGLTEAPHGYAAVAEAMRMAEQTTTLLREVMKNRAALRASATPKPAAFLPEDYTHVADLLQSNMVCEDQANLRAILSNNLNMIIAALRAGGV